MYLKISPSNFVKYMNENKFCTPIPEHILGKVFAIKYVGSIIAFLWNLHTDF